MIKIVQDKFTQDIARTNVEYDSVDATQALPAETRSDTDAAIAAANQVTLVISETLRGKDDREHEQPSKRPRANDLSLIHI